MLLSGMFVPPVSNGIEFLDKSMLNILTKFLWNYFEDTNCDRIRLVYFVFNQFEDCTGFL